MKKLIAVLFLVLCFAPTIQALDGDPRSPETKISFETKKLHLAKKTISVEVADTDPRRARGLMFREHLDEDHGMLFIFDSERPLGFWMKNTLIPLSIGFFDHDKRLVDTQEMVPAIAGEMSPRTYSSAAPALYALEMPKGWFAKHKIEKGTRFSLEESKKKSFD